MTNDEQKEMEMIAMLNSLEAQRNQALNAIVTKDGQITILDKKLTEANTEIEQLKAKVIQLEKEYSANDSTSPAV